MKDGCEIAPSCTSCPLPRCILDTGGPRLWEKEERNKEIVGLYNLGTSVPELAGRFHVTTRTIDQVLKRLVGKV